MNDTSDTLPVRRLRLPMLVTIPLVVFLAAAAAQDGAAPEAPLAVDEVLQEEQQPSPPNASSEAHRGLTVLLDADYQWNGGVVRRTLLGALSGEGFKVLDREAPFDERSLQRVDITIIAGAVAPENDFDVTTQTQVDRMDEMFRRWRLPVRPAFSAAEIETLKSWVQNGGSLMVVMDHMPLSGAVTDLAAAFDVRVSNGFVVDTSRLSGLGIEDVSTAATLLFTRHDGMLEPHTITNGRAEDEDRIQIVVSPAGSAVRLPEGADSLLTLGAEHVSLLPDVAWQFSDSTPRESVEGWSQFGVFRVGRGRVAFVAGLGLLAPSEALQAAGVRFPSGVDPGEVQNHQLLINTLRWLSGSLEASVAAQ